MQIAAQIVRHTNVYTNLNVDNANSPTAPTVVLLHGYGANGRDLVPCASSFQKSATWNWVFPEATQGLTDLGFGDAKAWFDLDVAQFQAAAANGGDIYFDRKTLAAARAAATKILKILEELKLDPKRTLLGGFSQGSMLALMVGLQMPIAPAGLLLYSCADVFGDENFGSLLTGDKKRPPIFQSHGRNDPVLAFGAGEALRDRMIAAGLEVEFREFRGGHEIPPPVLSASDRLATSWLAGV